MPTISLSNRSAGISPVSTIQENDSISAMYIVGFAIAGAAFLGIILWLGIYLYRRRHARQRRNQNGTAFLSIRGLVKEDEPYPEKTTYSQNSSAGLFSRNSLSPRVAMPTRALIETSPEQLEAERNYVIAQHRHSNNTPKPFSLAIQSPSSPSPTQNPDKNRLSVALTSEPHARNSRTSRLSTFSVASSYNESIISTTSSGGAGRAIRKVRQTFNPVLPDELLISPGEKLMVLQSFDDGWCVVGRESGILMPQPKSLFGGSRKSGSSTPTLLFGHGIQGAGVGTRSGGNVELGMVPAWCFLKSEQGVRTERPMRSSSLGVTVQMDSNVQGLDRNDMVSWSNF